MNQTKTICKNKAQVSQCADFLICPRCGQQAKCTEEHLFIDLVGYCTSCERVQLDLIN